MKHTNNIRLATLALAATTLTSLSSAQPVFSVEDLGAVNGESEAFAINNYNEVVGWTFMGNGTRSAVKWANGNLQVLNSASSAAYAINDNGDIVGKRGTLPVVFEGFNQIRQLATFGGPEGTASGINEQGRVAGSAQLLDGNWRGFANRYDLTQNPFNLGTLGGLTSIARDVNNVNCYTGWASTGGPNKAVIFVPGSPIQNLGTLGGPQSAGNAINDYFGVAGWSDLNVRHNAPSNQSWVRRAMLWTPEAGMRNLGEAYSAGKTIRTDSNCRNYFTTSIREGEFIRVINVYGVDTYGYGVNRTNAVCGYARLYTGPVARTIDRAFYWVNGKMYDLNLLIGNAAFEWQLTHAWAINDGHTIVGKGFNYRTGTFRAFKATRMN